MKPGKLILILLLWLPLTSLGQPVRGWAGFLFGGQSVWPGSAHAVQQQSQLFQTVGHDRYTLFGAEAYFRINNWLVGVNASALVNQRASGAGVYPVIESSASNAHLWVGWVAWQSKRAKVYPSIGPGVNSFNINSTRNNGSIATAALDGFAIDFGCTFDWQVIQPTTNITISEGPMLSVRAGYRLTTGSKEWHGDGTKPTTISPSRYAPRGFYITLGVGMGGFRHR